MPRTEQSATSRQYQQQFNSQLSKQLKLVRQAQPNHIPVFSMKYKNASKYLIQDLQEPLSLFPKKFPLKSVHQIIQKQSLDYCKLKLKQDPKIIQQADNFKLPEFYLYTISMLKPEGENNSETLNEKDSKNPQDSQKMSQKPSKPTQSNQSQQSSSQSSKTIGTFVKLDLQMSIGQAFDKYGRQNVLTIVYTDAAQVNLQYNKAVLTIQKWLIRIIAFIVILVLIPFVMKDSSSTTTIIDQTDLHQPFNGNPKRKFNRVNENGFSQGQESLIDERQLEIDVIGEGQEEAVNFADQRVINYDEESI